MPNWKRISSMPPTERLPHYQSYLEKRPNDERIWFDLGLAYKELRDWPRSVEANQRALTLSSNREDPAWWNLGIAATALHDWDLARRAWIGYGLTIDEGDGPVSASIGTCPVRLPNAEIVWGDRIDPARLTIRNIPLPDSGFRWGDVVLNDGQPDGERQHGGVRYPVFNVLERWSTSDTPTLSAEVSCASDQDTDDLIAAFEGAGFAAEDWTTNVRQLCAACSHGLPIAHEHEHTTQLKGTRSFGIAAPLDLASHLLRTWTDRSQATRSLNALTYAGLDE